jgi:hypothetical protein
MPLWLIYISSLVSFALIGLSMGGVYKLLDMVEFLKPIRNYQLRKLIRLFVCISILFPIWGFVFGFLGSGIGLSPTATGQGWLVSIGIAISISLFSWVTE